MEQTPAAESAAVIWLKRNFNWLVLALVFVMFVLPYVAPVEGLNFMQRFSEWVLRHLERLFKDYGYYVVFFGVLLENSMFLGLLVPGAIILILAGLSAENGSINIFWVLGLAMLATMIGDTVSYSIGRMGWTKVLERTGMDKVMDKVRGPMEANSTWLILTYHMAGYSRMVGPAAAGLFGIPFRRWAPLDYTGGAIWVLVFTSVGVVLGLAGLEFGDTKRTVRVLEILFLALFVGIVAMAILRSRPKADTGDGGPSDGRRPAPVIVPVEDAD